MKKFLITVKGLDIHPAGDSGEQDVQAVVDIPDRILYDVIDICEYVKAEMELAPTSSFDIVSMFYLGDFSE